MLQRLPIALAQVQAGNNSESFLNEIRKIVYSWHQSKQITKKCTITCEIYPIAYKMDTKLMNSENSITSWPHVLILKPTNTLD